jgi:hypothetical protein
VGVCVCVYVCVFAFVCVSIRICVWMWVSVSMCVCVFISVWGVCRADPLWYVPSWVCVRGQEMSEVQAMTGLSQKKKKTFESKHILQIFQTCVLVPTHGVLTVSLFYRPGFRQAQNAPSIILLLARTTILLKLSVEVCLQSDACCWEQMHEGFWSTIISNKNPIQRKSFCGLIHCLLTHQ